MSYPSSIKRIVPEKEWNLWQKKQQEFILKNQSTKVDSKSLENQNLHASYQEKHGRLEKLALMLKKSVYANFLIVFMQFHVIGQWVQILMFGILCVVRM